MNRKQIKNNNQGDAREVTSATPFAKPSAGHAPYPITFGAANSIICSDLKNLLHLPCIYCGKEMVPVSVFNALESVIGIQKLSLKASAPQAFGDKTFKTKTV